MNNYNPPNIHLLDNMFTVNAAAAEAAGIHKPTVIPTVTAAAQYVAGAAAAYPAVTTEMQLVQAQHAINLAQQPVATTANEQAQIIYQQQQQQQQQPISYKIPDQQQQQQEKSNKDIMAEATSKIFEDDKKPVPVSQSSTPTSTPLPTAIKSEPTAGTSGSNASSAAKSTPKPIIRQGGPVSVGRPRGGSINRAPHQRQQILPRLQLLEDEDDGTTCRMCLQSFWYKSQLIDHLRSTHSISDPERYEREEREKKMRRIREDQQRQILAKRQRLAALHGRHGRGFVTRGRGRFGSSHLRNLGSNMAKATGPRPSFQYRDGAFICDLCKKSFSDGNDMVTHWKCHVKKQRMQAAQDSISNKKAGRHSRHMALAREYAAEQAREGKGGRSDKGKPRWTAYLVWSTRRRKEIAEEEPDLSFAEVAKAISAEWKEVGVDEKERYQEEAEEMNALGIRKMPRLEESGSSEEDDVSDSESEGSWTENDSESDPEYDANAKPIMLKIKKEGEDDGKPRSTRKRKRPSFFQEFENEENNLDKILDEFEQEQIQEARKPRPERKPRDPNAPKRTRRKREPSPEEPKEPVELEKSRSGRVRKKPKFSAYFKGIEGEDEPEVENEEEDSEDQEFKPDNSEPEEEPEEEFVEEDIEEEEDEEEDGFGDGEYSTLPIKKRGRPKKLMTDEDIEEARKKALSSRKDGDESESEEDDENEDDPKPKEGAEGESPKAAAEGGEENKEGEDAPSEETDASKPQEENAAATEQETTNEAAPAAEETATMETEEQTSKAEEPTAAEVAAEEAPAVAAPEVPEEAVAAEPSVPSEPEPPAADDAAALLDSVVQPELKEPEETVSAISESVPSVTGLDEAVVQQVTGVVEDAAAEVPAEVAAAAEAVPQEAAAAAPVNDDELLTASESRMEEGDDKFKDIIAEGQIDNIFN